VPAANEGDYVQLHGIFTEPGSHDGPFSYRWHVAQLPFRYPDQLTVVGDKLFFMVYYPGQGYGLWAGDGTLAGTHLVKAFQYLFEMAAVGSTLFFAADDCVNGVELYRSDGTQAGTVLVKDIYPGSPLSSSFPADLTAVGSKLFFRAYSPGTGEEL